MKKFYITTPLYYVNAAPHIGHAYTTLAADILSRYKKSKGEPSHFLTGTDEHGANIEKVAREAKQTPKEWADSYAQKFKDMWASLNISYDDFIRTTEPRHESAVQEVFERLLKSGDIYKGKYEGWYCLPCENYIEESELKEGKCPVHGRAVEKLTEETYFFRLSKFEKPLLKHYKDNPVFLSPKHRAKEITNFVSSGLKDISVSRTKVSWGIPVKSDPSHTIYVWFDALLNYATAAGLYNPSADFNSLWPADVHLVGKEIYRFHAIIWPAMLMALELPLPKQVFAHGWWTVNGEKMSKSRGNFVDPHGIIHEYGVDAFRYFIFREVPFGSDGDFSMDSFKQRYNADLANNLGNLLSRVTNMVDKYLFGELPAKAPSDGSVLVNETRVLSPKIDAHICALEFDKALEIIWSAVTKLNQAVDREKPWTKEKADPAGLKLFLFELVWSLRMIAGWLEPFMPDTCAKMHAQLGVRADCRESGEKIQKAPPLFPRK